MFFVDSVVVHDPRGLLRSRLWVRGLELGLRLQVRGLGVLVSGSGSGFGGAVSGIRFWSLGFGSSWFGFRVLFF